MAANEFYVRKINDSLAQFAQGRRLFAGSRYRMVVAAADFAADLESAAFAHIALDGVRVASCELVPDPLRRGVRAGELTVPPDGAGASTALVVELGGNVVLEAPASVSGWTVTAAPAASAVQSGSRWTVVDLGTLDGSAVSVSDMTQVKFTAAHTDSPLSLASSDPGGWSLDVYVVVTASDDPGFPFSGVLVDGRAPVWRHQDSFRLPATRWVLHVMKVAGGYFASLYAEDVPAGAELDPDGAVVVSAEVNR